MRGGDLLARWQAAKQRQQVPGEDIQVLASDPGPEPAPENLNLTPDG
jgi:hypothetical protein